MKQKQQNSCYALYALVVILTLNLSLRARYKTKNIFFISSTDSNFTTCLILFIPMNILQNVYILSAYTKNIHLQY